jgi:hypothetical protein
MTCRGQPDVDVHDRERTTFRHEVEVRRIERAQVHRRQDVDVVQEERRVAAEQRRACSSPPPVSSGASSSRENTTSTPKPCVRPTCSMMRSAWWCTIDDETVGTGVDEARATRSRRFSRDVDQRLRRVPRDVAQPRAEARGQDHGVHGPAGVSRYAMRCGPARLVPLACGDRAPRSARESGGANRRHPPPSPGQCDSSRCASRTLTCGNSWRMCAASAPRSRPTGAGRRCSRSRCSGW